MPLPRFHRLPAHRQAEILKVARAHFGRDGRDGASLNQIVVEARLSKTSAYQYFDGKDDLAAAVLADVNARLLGVLGPWKPTSDAASFWRQLKDGSARLSAHVLAHPDDLACLRVLRGDAGSDADLGWFHAVVDNGIALALIRADLDRGLLIAATVGFFRAVDAWALDAMARGLAPPLEQAWTLLAGLWGSPAIQPGKDGDA